jgi:hypothetical protein
MGVWFFGVVGLTHHWGYVGAVVSAVLFGMWATLSKLVLVDVHPSVVAGLKAMLGVYSLYKK